MRLHRSLAKAASKISPDEVANLAEDYLAALKLYRRDVEGVKGLASVKRIMALVAKIDEIEKEALKLERKIEDLLLKRGVVAVELKEELGLNLEVLAEYLSDEEMSDFPKL